MRHNELHNDGDIFPLLVTLLSLQKGSIPFHLGINRSQSVFSVSSLSRYFSFEWAIRGANSVSVLVTDSAWAESFGILGYVIVRVRVRVIEFVIRDRSSTGYVNPSLASEQRRSLRLE